MLGGTIRCGSCDTSYGGTDYGGTSGTGRTGGVARYYSCGIARRWGTKECAGPSIPAEDLDLQLQGPALPVVPTEEELAGLRTRPVKGIRDGDIAVRDADENKPKASAPAEMTTDGLRSASRPSRWS